MNNIDPEIVDKLQSDIQTIGGDTSLRNEKNFDARVDAIDFIDSWVIDQIEAPAVLRQYAERIKTELEQVDINLFKRLRNEIGAKQHRGKDFIDLVKQYVHFNPKNEEAGYDNLDIFINQLFSFLPVPRQSWDLQADMVYYQKTPARVVLEIVEIADLNENDVFVDLGSGLGQVAMLIHILTGITVKGVEFEPAFCDYAAACAKELNLTGTKFINTDARDADYSAGTVFFMYTPFTGQILQNVLEMLKKESLNKKIRIITYGPCTIQIAEQPWLVPLWHDTGNIYKPVVFKSL